MAITISIPSNLRQHTEGLAVVDVNGSTVGECIAHLCAVHPQVQPRLLAEDGQPHSFINLFVDGRSIRQLEQLETSVQPGATIVIVPALAGG
jgi:molybdopterin converting factor small subunit